MKGKRVMRRNYTPFVTGMVTMALLIGLISASFAANDSKKTASGGAVPADIGIGIFLQQQIAPGEMLTTEQGGKAPKVLAYDDTKGETHYYIEATAVAELFDVSNGVNFHEEANQLEFGANAAPDWDEEGNVVRTWNLISSISERHDFMIGATIDGKTGESLIDGGGVDTATSSGYIFSHSQDVDRSGDPELQREYWAKYKSLCQERPEYGKTQGMYTEVDPAEINLSTLSGVAMKDKLFQDETEVQRLFCFTSRIGKYAAITIENTGTSEAKIDVWRLNTVGGDIGTFTSVYLPAGAKIMRAFRIDDTKPLENQLVLRAQPLGPGGVSVKLTEEQYRSGN